MDNRFSIGFFGDFTTGENYQLKSDSSERINVLRQYGYGWLFQEVEPLLSRFDLNIFNLETPLTSCVKSSLAHKKTVLHWADPEIVPELLKKYNVAAVSLGNNHALDYDRQGLLDTINALNKVGIFSFGAGLNLNTAQLPFIKHLTVGNSNVNIYVIGGFKYKKEYDVEFKFYADEKKEGVFMLNETSADDLIRSIKTSDANSIVVVFPHFGFDLMKTTQMQTDYAHSFIDSGADYVIGHGPHMMNSIEKYKGKTILYSIGNFIFPANFKGKVLPNNLVAELEIVNDASGISSHIWLYPTYMNNQSNKTRTRMIKENELTEVINLLIEGNEDLKSSLVIENTDGIFRIGV